MVIHTLKDNTAPNRYGTPRALIFALRKSLKLKPIPTSYKKDQKMLWIMDNVSIMPLGIRHDSDMVEPKDMGFKDWTHESI